MSALGAKPAQDTRAYRDRFVAMFDILGFKTLRKSLGTVRLHAKFRDVVGPEIVRAAAGGHEVIVRNGQALLVPKQNVLSLSYVVFSDTVFLWSYDASYTAFLAMLNTSRILVASGFGTSMPFRGAIGYGDAIMGPDIYVGSAIEDAYAGEQMQAWSGCMITQKCREFIESRGYRAEFEKVVPEVIAKLPPHQQEAARSKCVFPPLYHVPIKAKPLSGAAQYSTVEAYVIDWTDDVSDGVARNAFLPSEDAHANMIVANTVTFDAWARRTAGR